MARRANLNVTKGKQGFQETSRGRVPPTVKPETGVVVDGAVVEEGFVLPAMPEFVHDEKSFGPDGGPKGEDAPSAAISLRGGGRVYVKDLKDADLVREDLDAAFDNGLAFGSITTFLGVLDKPALKVWAANEAGKAANEYMGEIDDLLQAGTLDSVEAARRKVAEWREPTSSTDSRSKIDRAVATAYQRSQTSSADRGTGVHAVVEELSRGGNPTVSKEHEGYVAAYKKFREDFPGMRIVATEVTVFNFVDGPGYAGTIDAIAELPGENGGPPKRVLIDWKTNKNAAVYDPTGLQLAAAANATHVRRADGTFSEFGPVDGVIGVGLSPDGKYSVRPFDKDKNFKAFMGAMLAWHGLRNAKKDVKSVSGMEELRNFYR